MLILAEGMLSCWFFQQEPRCLSHPNPCYLHAQRTESRPVSPSASRYLLLHSHSCLSPRQQLEPAEATCSLPSAPQHCSQQPAASSVFQVGSRQAAQFLLKQMKSSQYARAKEPRCHCDLKASGWYGPPPFSWPHLLLFLERSDCTEIVPALVSPPSWNPGTAATCEWLRAREGRAGAGEWCLEALHALSPLDVSSSSRYIAGSNQGPLACGIK